MSTGLSLWGGLLEGLSDYILGGGVLGFFLTEFSDSGSVHSNGIRDFNLRPDHHSYTQGKREPLFFLQPDIAS